MYTLKSIVRRGTLLSAAAALVVAAVIPAASVSADSLNPLTQRSLLLTSSAPGYTDTDGSGNSTAAPSSDPINGTYARAGSGANGKKTGETFTFNVSTDSAATTTPIKAFSLQYCTGAAGKCQAPGNNTGDAKSGGTRDGDTASTSDLNVNYTTPVINTDYDVYVNNVLSTPTDWVMKTKNVEDQDHTGALTGKNNFIILESATGISPAFNDTIKLVFRASETNHITNPGAGSFFVKINTYKTVGGALGADLLPTTAANIIDGGVTVANVMTDSIHITTKVLETMSFSVGTQNRDTVVVKCVTESPNVPAGCESTAATHGPCDPIASINNNRLNLGDPNNEYSLQVDKAWDVYSYWRLSSNSSGGATVYYSGNTLANTVGDEISEIGSTATASLPGAEQFGLAFVDATTDDTTPTDKFDPVFTALTGSDDRFSLPTLNYLVPEVAYAGGAGTITQSGTAKFAFQKSSNTVPVTIAKNNDHVISCDTAKVRYMANIGADTPAGVYTTKINYLAAPQY